LEKRGFNITTAISGSDAKELIKNNKFDLILLDLLMPVIGGITLVDFIRNEQKSTVPIFIISACTEKAQIQEALDHGANEYLFKPINQEELISKLNNFLQVDMLQISESTQHEVVKEQDNKFKVFAIEDNHYDVLYIQHALEELDICFLHHCNPTSVIPRLLEEMPNVIILDIFLPEITGLQLLEKIKYNKQLCDIPVIVISVHTGTDIVKVAKEAGAVAYFTKPYQKEKLLTLINKIYSKKDIEFNFVKYI
ncbi:MAG: hypothetical protein C0594_12695, partial [Marinilabiliales bacterium]